VVFVPQHIQAPSAATQNAPVKVGSQQMCGIATTHRVEYDLGPLVRNEGAIFHDIAVGLQSSCYLTMIQNAENVVPQRHHRGREQIKTTAARGCGQR